MNFDDFYHATLCAGPVSAVAQCPSVCISRSRIVVRVRRLVKLIARPGSSVIAF